MVDALNIYAVYRHPSDYPDKYVVRRHVVNQGPTEDFHVEDTLEAVRSHIPPYCYRLDRMATDDPKILETWL
jgi:hypothetical protein